MTRLIRAGADLNLQDKYRLWTALHCAADKGHNEVLTTLILSGADLDIRNKDGNTALHSATNRGQTEVIATLVSAGADLNMKNKDAIVCVDDGIARLE